MNVQDKFSTTRQELNSSLIEREDEVTIAMTALLAGEHCLFVGPPGTAKSLLADSIVSWMDGSKFTLLVNKHTKPEEVFGPVSIMGLKADEFRRITTGKLPEAEVAFLDEIFKGSSAILNTMLKLLNERKFENGGAVVDCPLQLCIGASNEWPMEAKELGALFDRFLFRKLVDPVGSSSGIERLMFDPNLTPSLSTTLTQIELNEARAECNAVRWDDETKEASGEIRRRLFREGITIGDRRIRKSVHAVECHAWLNGRDTVTTDDLAILQHLWWSDPNGQPNVVRNAILDIAAPSDLLVTQFVAEINEIVATTDHTDLEQSAKASSSLSEIGKRLRGMKGQRAEAATERVREAISTLRQGLVQSF